MVLGGAVSSTRHGALRSTYSVTSPISGGRAAPIPPRIAPPRTRLGGSPPITIASTPRRRAASTIPAPMFRAGTTSVTTSTDSYSSATCFARRNAASARSISSFGGGALTGSVSGSAIT